MRTERARRSLLRFIPLLSPKYAEPRHLSPLIERLELAAEGVPQFVVCHAPPRHAKTETVLHYLPWVLQRRPEWTLSYTTYGDRLARSKSRKSMALAEAAGLRLAVRTRNEWRTEQGGGVLAGGIRGPLTGHGVNIGLIDDAVKNRIDAESANQREANWEWFQDVLLTRIEPGGSVFVFMTRWHPDDLSGRLLREGWDSICLPAISDEGAALWPERWSAEALEKKKAQVGIYTWASLYQGQPRPRGGQVFGEPTFYDEKPKVYRAALGVDLAYTKKKSADHSACVTMLLDGTGKKYVVDVIRRQVRVPEFRATLKRQSAFYPGSRGLMYTSTTEQGIVDLMREAPEGFPIDAMVAKGDKFTRAQPYAAEWNAGNVLVPRAAPWLDRFLSEHASFTGVDDPEDDQVDAAVAACDQLTTSGAGMTRTEPPSPARPGLAGQEM